MLYSPYFVSVDGVLGDVVISVIKGKVLGQHIHNKQCMIYKELQTQAIVSKKET